MTQETIVYIDEDLEELIPDYMENRHSDIEQIKRLLQEENFSEIQRLGHSMKGSGGGYGFDEITNIGRDIEEAAKTHDTEKIVQAIDYLLFYLSTVKIVVQ